MQIRLKSSKGMTLIELLVSVGILSGIFLLIVVVNKMSYQVQNQSTVNETVSQIRSYYMTILGKDMAIKYSIDDPINESMKCLRDNSNTPCLPGVENHFALKDVNNNLIYDSTKSSTGLTALGQSCNEFNEVSGNDQCPLRVDLMWVAMCEANKDCSKPDIDIIINFKYKPKTNTQTNVAKYNLRQSRKLFSQINPVANCGSQGKIYMPDGFANNPADAEGCIDPNLLLGPKGTTGNPGSKGPTGDPGEAGGCI